jgi:hypothetical protein
MTPGMNSVPEPSAYCRTESRTRKAIAVTSRFTFLGSGAPSGFENLFPAVDALMKRFQPGTPEFLAEFQKIAAVCDIVNLGLAPK